MKRQTRSASALATALAAVALLAAAPPALAGQTGKVRLVRPVTAPDGDATGVVKIRERRAATLLKVNLRHLAPGRMYAIHDAHTDELLGSGDADRKGRLQVKVREPRDAEGPAKRAARDIDIVVREEGTDAFLLVGGDIGDPTFGDAFYGTLNGPNLAVSLFSDGDSCDAFFAGLTARTDDGVGQYEIYFDSVGGDTLPLGVDSVADLAGRAFDVQDADGTEVLTGDLPEMVALDDLKNGRFEFATPAAGNADDRVFTAPFSLRIANDDDALTAVGEFRSFDLEFPDDFRYGSLCFGRFDEGASGSVGLFADSTGEGISVQVTVVDSTSSQGVTLHLWDASRSGGRGELPLGVDSVSDLSGRVFELRDADGAVLVSDRLPELSSGGDVRYDPLGTGGATQGDVVDPGTPPYSMWIADDDGVLTEVGTLQELDLGKPAPEPWDPGTFRSATVFLGNGNGDSGSIGMFSSDEGDFFDVVLFSPENRADHVWSYSAMTADGGTLPLGVDSVADLSGRALEIRNRDDETVVALELPELSDTLNNALPDEPGETLTLGAAPYTLFIADDSGALVEVAVLEEMTDGVVIALGR